MAFRRILSLATLLGGGVVSGAEEAAQRAGPAESPPAAIEAARRDFEAAKSLRSLGPEARINAPALSLPQFPSDAAPTAPKGATRSFPSQKSSSSNWLLEGMEQRRKSSDVRSRGSEGVGLKPVESHDGLRPTETGTFQREGVVGDTRMESLNPFSRYLGEWMSPQDYALLQPALDPARGGSFASSRLSPVAGNSSVVVQPRQISELSALKTNDLPSHRTSTGSGERPNPYLETEATDQRTRFSAPVMPPAIAPSGLTNSRVPGPGKTPPRSSEVIVPEVKNTGTSGRIPEFVRPDNDEKYFKPLKRF